MKNLNYQLKTLCRQNRDGGHSTQVNRAYLLNQMANHLHELGYRNMNAKSLRPKHVERLLKYWTDQGIGNAALKNRLSAIRWWAGKVNKHNVVSRSNSVYGIGQVPSIPESTKAQQLDLAKVSEIPDLHIQLSIRLQSAFGLRREEAIKFQPTYAIGEKRISLKASWTKGGRARSVPILTEEQRELLQQVTALAKGGALIPSDSNYVTQLRRYERLTRAIGLRNLHGLRHDYAQRRYHFITGWACAAAGGPKASAMSSSERCADRDARLIISGELGHSREAIAATYLGR